MPEWAWQIHTPKVRTGASERDVQESLRQAVRPDPNKTGHNRHKPEEYPIRPVEIDSSRGHLASLLLVFLLLVIQ